MLSPFLPFLQRFMPVSCSPPPYPLTNSVLGLVHHDIMSPPGTAALCTFLLHDRAGRGRGVSITHNRTGVIQTQPWVQALSPHPILPHHRWQVQPRPAHRRCPICVPPCPHCARALFYPRCFPTHPPCTIHSPHPLALGAHCHPDAALPSRSLPPQRHTAQQHSRSPRHSSSHRLLAEPPG